MSEVPLYAVDWLDVDHCAIDSMHQYAFDMIFQHEREVQYTTHSEAWKLVYAQFARGDRAFRITSHRGTSLIRNVLLLGPYNEPMPRALRWAYGGGRFL